MQYVPTVFVKQETQWEYEVAERDSAEPMSAAELNTLGESGWELAGVLSLSAKILYYFKRIT